MPTPTETIREQVGRLQPQVDQVLTVFQDANLSPADGEFILAWCLGLSLGLRAADVKTHFLAIADGWIFGAKEG
jgi:hypothetical protein